MAASYIRRVLVWLDQGVNVLAAPALNLILKPTAARFGSPDETLSSVFGKNIEAGACVGCKVICRVLHWVDTGHCNKSIERDEGVS